MNVTLPVDLSDERLGELIAIVSDPHLAPGPLDQRDLVAALSVLANVPHRAAVACHAPQVNCAIADGLREAALATGPGPLAERLQQAAAAMDVLCGTIVAALQCGDLGTGALGELLRASLVTAGAR